MTTLIFVRHGQSLANRERFFAGHTDVPLLDSGVAQAKATAEYIADTYKIDKAYASDLIRARKTGEVIAERLGLTVTCDEGLREIYGGEWEGVPFARLTEEYPESYRIWREDIGRAVCDGGESLAELGARVLATCKRIAEENDGKTILIATHAAAIRSFMCLCAGRPIEDMQDIPWVSNASVTEIEYSEGEWKIVTAGYDAHLEDLRTVLPRNV